MKKYIVTTLFFAAVLGLHSIAQGNEGTNALKATAHKSNTSQGTVQNTSPKAALFDKRKRAGTANSNGNNKQLQSPNNALKAEDKSGNNAH